MTEENNVYRIKLFRWKSLENRDEYRRFCLEKGILAVGWPAPTDINYENEERYAEKVNNMFFSSKELKNKTPEEQEKYIEDKKKEGKPYSNKKSWSTARNIFFEMKENQNNFIWTQESGNSYYLGKITDNKIRWYGGKYRAELEEKLKEYRNNGGDKDRVIDLKKFGLWRSCNWNGKEFDDVPGNVIASLSAQGTMSRIPTEDQKAFYTYCHYLYDETIPTDKLSFWDLVHYDDLEDLVGLFLQKEYGYFIFPSTNKQDTKDYEYKLIQKDSNKKNREEAIIQCKHTDNIKFDKLKDYKENIFLLTVNGNIDWGKNGIPRDKKVWEWLNQETNEKEIIGWEYYQGRIKEFNAVKLKEWASKEENEPIMPKRIRNFIKISH